MKGIKCSQNLTASFRRQSSVLQNRRPAGCRLRDRRRFCSSCAVAACLGRLQLCCPPPPLPPPHAPYPEKSGRARGLALQGAIDNPPYPFSFPFYTKHNSLLEW
ncbi:hypothetical protein M9H77_23983 [Catharanthus roseus]|uniref:Uncharacterized protein n=1 Tax=Catharanthus roseus TaxID=4058 RepID=A0ACC0AUU3_CATRO|nr:hypothetical protein M9H77_23983 [Catharanthus roseus]